MVIAAIIIGICGEETRGRSLEEINDNVFSDPTSQD